jgi:IS30 family transposase
MNKYKHLSLVERAQIEILLTKGYSQGEIAGVLGRDHATISRELKRRVQGVYVARKANHKAYVKRKYSKYQGMKIQQDMKLQEYVTKYLKNGWSPEQVAGRIAKDVGLAVVSHTSIYTWLRSIHGRRLEAELKLLKRKRGTKKRLKVLELEGRVFIDERPKTIDSREYFGDWEGDFIVSGKGGRGAILVLHERKSRYSILRRVMHRSASAVERTLVEMISPLSNFRSLTLDNDIAFVHHEKISKELGAPIFFCHPYASWQKGGVENTNRMIRRFVPKGADISKYSSEDIQKIEWSINSIPRKILGYATAEEVMLENEQMIKSYIQIGRENY